MKFLCKILGHKMYSIKPFFNLTTGWIYNVAIEQERCMRCGRNSHEDLYDNLNL